MQLFERQNQKSDLAISVQRSLKSEKAAWPLRSNAAFRATKSEKRLGHFGPTQLFERQNQKSDLAISVQRSLKSEKAAWPLRSNAAFRATKSEKRLGHFGPTQLFGQRKSEKRLGHFGPTQLIESLRYSWTPKGSLDIE